MTMLLAIVAFLTLSPVLNAATHENEWTVGRYQLETSYESNGDRRLTILKDGKDVYSKAMGQFWFVSLDRGNQTGTGSEPVTADVNGDGIQDLVIEHFPRHAQCCWGYTIVSLGETPKELANLEGFPSPLTFHDVNADGIYEVITDDWNYYSWYASPRVIFRYENGEYKLASNLMKRPAPTPRELAAKAAEFRKAPLYNALPVPLEVYRYMLDLIYSGNEKSAWAFLNRVWPAQRTDKQQFIESFKEQLAKSRFWPEVHNMSQTASGPVSR